MFKTHVENWSERLLLDLLRSNSEGSQSQLIQRASATMLKRKHEPPSEEVLRILHAVYSGCISRVPAEAQTAIAELRAIMDQGSKESRLVATNVLGYLDLQVDGH